ncbi:hypothetical protein [Streptomyces sp. NPDC003032]
MSTSTHGEVWAVVGYEEARAAPADPRLRTIICGLFGVPVEDREQFRRWAAEIVAATSLEEGTAAARAIIGYLSSLVETKRRSAGDGDGDRLSPGELLNMAYWLLFAAEPVELAGATVTAGDKVLIVLSAASDDRPATFRCATPQWAASCPGPGPRFWPRHGRSGGRVR